ncbi:MAG: AMP-binding protein [Acidobacteriota bacterium]
MRTLLDLLDEIRKLEDGEAVRFNNGYRTWILSYRQILQEASRLAGLLGLKGLKQGDRLILWSENRPEWVTAFWACLSMGVQVVPIDFRSSPSMVESIQQQVQAGLLMHGSSVDPGTLSLPCWPLDQASSLPAAAALQPVAAAPQDIVEIVYTSGTTGDPKGVVHRHRNIVANLNPLASEIDAYKKYARPFQPIRILNLLPLSHMFGQAMGLFIPVLLGGAAVFMADIHPAAVIRTVRGERVSALVTVPRILKALEDEIERRFQPAPARPHRKGIAGILQRWWRYRRVHSALGWKFWALTVGGAEVDRSAEEFWARLGYAVIQGYGLTETSPVVAVNHPFFNQPGSIGKVLPGQEVQIAQDGEILVRGDSVVAEYWTAGGIRPVREEQGWLHTGDIGEFDSQGRLYYRGRKKDLIVTSEGMNVFPQDVEKALNAIAEVQEAAVVPLRKGGDEVVHAALLLADGQADPAALVRQANSSLEPHQRIRSWSVWPEDDFPRTSSTFKVQRRLVAERIRGKSQPDPGQAAAPEALTVNAILSRMTGQAPDSVQDSLRLAEDLGISSLDRIELLAQLEDAYQLAIDEESFSLLGTVGDLRNWVRRASRGRPPRLQDKLQPTAPDSPPNGSEVEPSDEMTPTPRSAVRPLPEQASSLGWHGRPMGWLRKVLLEALIFPLYRHYIPMQIEGRQHLDDLPGQVIFAANHASHLDTPAIYQALPYRWRHRLAPAMRQEFFRPYFWPQGHSLRQRCRAGLQYHLAAGLFAAYPLPHRGGIRRTLRYTGSLVEKGYCPLIFPEGRRTPDGEILPFQPGVGLMALQLRLPVVPIHLSGLFEILSVHDEWPKAGPVRAVIGAPLHFEGTTDPGQIASRVEAALRRLGQARGQKI